MSDTPRVITCAEFDKANHELFEDGRALCIDPRRLAIGHMYAELLNLKLFGPRTHKFEPFSTESGVGLSHCNICGRTPWDAEAHDPEPEEKIQSGMEAR